MILCWHIHQEWQLSPTALTTVGTNNPPTRDPWAQSPACVTRHFLLNFPLLQENLENMFLHIRQGRSVHGLLVFLHHLWNASELLDSPRLDTILKHDVPCASPSRTTKQPSIPLPLPSCYPCAQRHTRQPVQHHWLRIPRGHLKDAAPAPFTKHLSQQGANTTPHNQKRSPQHQQLHQGSHTKSTCSSRWLNQHTWWHPP